MGFVSPIRVTNYNTENLFYGFPQAFFKDFTYTNSTGSTVELTQGRLMGQVLSTAKVLPQVSSATDGSEMPIGILGHSISVADGDTVTLSICIEGKVNQNLLILANGDTLNTAVRTVSTGGGTIGALIERNTQIVLVPTEQNSNYDNAIS